MTTTLRVIVDDILASSSPTLSCYTEEITLALIGTAPVGCEVNGIVSARPEPAYAELARRLPGLGGVFKSALTRRDLQLSWRHGLTPLPGGGMLHSPSLLAPLVRHDRVNRPNDQTVVTVHDTFAWTHPQGLTSHQIAWQKAMAKRAHRFADAVVVPTYAVGRQLDDIYPFGDRIRVIGGAARSSLALPEDPESRARAMELPARYLFTVGDAEERGNLIALLRSLTRDTDAGLPLVIAAPSPAGDVDSLTRLVVECKVPPERVRFLGHLGDRDLTVAYSRAAVVVLPGLAEGFGQPLLEAFNSGTPVIHSDDPALVEIAAGCGVTVPLANSDEYPDRLAAAITSVVNDATLAERLRYAGLDRARAFSWREAAQRVWALHADL